MTNTTRTSANNAAANPDRQDEQASGESIAAAVHELNNILSVIMTESELAVLVGSDKKRVQALRAIVTSATQMREILGRLQATL